MFFFLTHKEKEKRAKGLPPEGALEAVLASQGASKSLSEGPSHGEEGWQVRGWWCGGRGG